MISRPVAPDMASLVPDVVVCGSGVAGSMAAVATAHDVPMAGVKRIEQAQRQALGETAVRKCFKSFGVTLAHGTRSALRDYVRSEGQRWADVIRTRGIKAE